MQAGDLADPPPGALEQQVGGSSRAATRGEDRAVIELEFGITVYPPQPGRRGPKKKRPARWRNTQDRISPARVPGAAGARGARTARGRRVRSRGGRGAGAGSRSAAGHGRRHGTGRRESASVDRRPGTRHARGVLCHRGRVRRDSRGAVRVQLRGRGGAALRLRRDRQGVARRGHHARGRGRASRQATAPDGEGRAASRPRDPRGQPRRSRGAAAQCDRVVLEIRSRTGRGSRRKVRPAVLKPGDRERPCGGAGSRRGGHGRGGEAVADRGAAGAGRGVSRFTAGGGATGPDRAQGAAPAGHVLRRAPRVRASSDRAVGARAGPAGRATEGGDHAGPVRQGRAAGRAGLDRLARGTEQADGQVPAPAGVQPAGNAGPVRRRVVRGRGASTAPVPGGPRRRGREHRRRRERRHRTAGVRGATAGRAGRRARGGKRRVAARGQRTGRGRLRRPDPDHGHGGQRAGGAAAAVPVLRHRRAAAVGRRPARGVAGSAAAARRRAVAGLGNGPAGAACWPCLRDQPARPLRRRPGPPPPAGPRLARREWPEGRAVLFALRAVSRWPSPET